MKVPKPVIGGIAASLLISVPLIAGGEGKSNDPYNDLVGVPTVCYGETRVPMRKYSDAECTAMLHKATSGFTNDVIKVTPGLQQYPYQLAAATSLAYNIGIGNYRTSTVAKRFNSGNYTGACDAFMMWTKARVNGKLTEIKGLVNRRKKEVAVCYKGF